MPDFITNSIQVFDKIIEIYANDVRSNLEKEAKDLIKQLKIVLDKHAKTYSLETENDVNPIRYYSIKYRIKGEMSLKEKLVRKNDGFKIIARSGINNSSEIDSNKQSLINQLNIIPDIIGVRIVTELKFDCRKVLSLIRAFVDELTGEQIVLDKVDLESQPQPMKNGLSIYKIKGIFKSIYGFELQIKSKLEEAWGDMDHAIFYKDYSVTPVKNVTQVTMNNVGILLEDIDNLLLGLRNSDSQYQESLEHLNNLKELNDELHPLVAGKLGIGFEIGKIASFLNFVKGKANEGIARKIHLTDLDCSFLEFSLTSSRCQNYAAIRAKSFELMIIELSYFNWAIKNGKIELNQNNYESQLEIFLNHLSSHIFKVIEEEKVAISAEIGNSENLSSKIAGYSTFVKNHDIYLSEKTLITILEIEGTIEEFFQENEAYFDEGEDYIDFKTAFKILYITKTLRFDDTEAIKNLREKFSEKESSLNSSLESIAYDFKEHQRKNQRNARADQKEGEVVKESTPSIAVTESIVNNLKTNTHGK